MSDVTRPAGGAPAERGQHHAPDADARGETALGTGATPDPEAPPGARADHGVGAHTEATPQLHTEGTRPAATATRATATQPPTPRPETSLLPHEECGKLEERLHHAVSGFVDGPRAAVEEADRVLEEITTRFTDAVTRRRRTLRASWQSTDTDKKAATATDTEQLRLALRDYRELSESLMRL
ncbi:hypothetical protein [Streptomyces sp. JW3]|uniref:hypothetical protein n=1 Tax=Streptomyces sp. JW3 TaxID=3456955 RepID=UPI003FA46DEC